MTTDDTMTADEQLEEARRFLALLFDPQDWIEVRLLPAKGRGGKQRWFRLADADAGQVLAWAIANNARDAVPDHAYFGANPRAAEGKSEAVDVTLARTLFADFDKGATVEEALHRIRAARLPEPSIVLVSGGGVHVYWLLAEPITDLTAWTATVKRVIAAVGSDKTIHDAPRIMRLPGTRNVKPERPGRPWCRIVTATDQRHDVAAFRPAPLGTFVPAGKARKLSDAGRRYIATGQVEGGRREALFTIACDMQANGWKLEDATSAIMSRVHMIVPALEADQVADLPRQIGNAFKQDREPGHRAGAATPMADDQVDDQPAPESQLVLVRASEIPCTPINWLWPQRIVGDGLTIVTGPVGISKSLISVDVAARVTTGGKWPDGTGHAPQGSVILFGAEDDAGKVVVPRLQAAGADLERVLVCQGTSDGNPEREPESVILERHIGQLRAALDTVTDCRLVVFDPLPDYLAADENSSREVRAALLPLARLAQDRNVAVVAVLHQNKKTDLTTVQRIAGSGAFAQIARIVLAIGAPPKKEGDETTDTRRVMTVAKSNYGQRDVGQAYEIETRSNGQPGIVWHPGIVTIDADSLSRSPTGGSQHEEKRGEAVDVLRELLAEGEKNAGAVGEEMQDRGFGRRQIAYAADTLNVVKRKVRDGWTWRLPSPRRRPAVTTAAPATPDPHLAKFAPAGDLDEVEAFNRT